MFQSKYIKKLEKNLNNLVGLISIARKAGFCIIGQDKLRDYDKKLYLILLDKNAGKSLERQMSFLSKDREIPLHRIEGLAEMLAIENCKVVGIKNKAISENLIKSLKGDN